LHLVIFADEESAAATGRLDTVDEFVEAVDEVGFSQFFAESREKCRVEAGVEFMNQLRPNWAENKLLKV
jgi:hypothetical protein